MTKAVQDSPVVLVVDDNATNLGVLFDCLGDNGFKALVAEDGESALAQAAYARPDIILLDVMMPGMDGFETCRRLRADPATKDIPVIFMTALTDAADKVKSFQVGAVDYVTKPFQHEEVLVRLTNHLRIRDLQKTLEAQNAALEREVAQRRQTETELARRLDELHTANAELDAFARTVAHDLKDPLARLLSVVEIVDEGDVAVDEMKRLLGVIGDTARQMNGIVSSLLLLAYVRHADVAHEPLDMAAIVTTCQDKLAHMVEEYSARIVTATDWPVATGYAPWIEHVWVNYLSNAIKYGGRPPLIELGAAPVDPEHVRFWVRDNGPGLTQGEQARLFNEFTKLGQHEERGHGLGLSIVRRIVTRLGGEVGVTSQPGRGSEFYFTLKAA